MVKFPVDLQPNICVFDCHFVRQTKVQNCHMFVLSYFCCNCHATVAAVSVAAATATTIVVTADVDSYKAMVAILVLCQLEYSLFECFAFPSRLAALRVPPCCLATSAADSCLFCMTCVLLYSVYAICLPNRITLAQKIVVVDFMAQPVNCQHLALAKS